MLGDLAGRKAVVGGASSGLGLAVADGLAAAGCDLVIWARGTERLERVRDELRDRYRVRVESVAADASAANAAGVVVERAQATLGAADIVVLNAGGPPTTDPTATTPEQWVASLQLLLLTPVAVASQLLPPMRAQGWGRVIAILSSGVRQPIDGLVYSNCGRAALAAWLKTTATVVARDGVTVNGVLPGRIATGRVVELDGMRAAESGREEASVRTESEKTIPLGRYGRPDELAALTTFLAGPAASYITGSLLSVDGGLMRGA